MDSNPGIGTHGENKTSSYIYHPAKILTLLLLIVLVITWIAIIGLYPTADDFDGDEYWFSVRVDRDFSKYLTEDSMLFRPLLGWQFGIPFKLSENFVSQEHSDYYAKRLAWGRVPAFISGVLCLIITIFFTRRLPLKYPISKILPCIAFVFLDSTIRYHRWGMAIFSEYMTLMTALFFLWIQLARGKKVTKWQKRAMVILSIVTPLVYFPMLPAFFTGVAVTLLFRTLGRSNGSIVARLATELKNLSWFMLSIPSFALAALAEPWALGKRPSRDPFFFSTSEFQQTIGGMFQFVNEKTQLLFHELLSIDTGVHDGVGSSLAMILGFLVFVGALYIRFSHNENGLGTLSIFKIIHVHFPPNLENANSDRLFTIFYVGLCLGGTAALSLADLYPYGTIRYGLHLLVPILVLATFGLDDVLILFSRVTRAFSNTLSIPSMSNRIYEACSVVVLVVLLVIIVATSLGRVNELRTERVAMIRENERIRSIIKREDYQLLLYTPDTIRFFQALAPEKLSHALNMGYGVRRRGKDGYQAQNNTDDLISMINSNTTSVNSVLFSYWGAGTPGENHPEYIEVFPPQTWAITDEARRLDHVTLLSLSMFAIDPLDSKLPTRISRSVFEITEKGTLYLRGWAVSPQVIDRVEVRCNGEALGPVEFPTRRADVLKNVPEYRTEWCGYVLEIPYEPRFSENDLFVEVFSGGVSLGKINIGKVK